jgi:hypothetical protein
MPDRRAGFRTQDPIGQASLLCLNLDEAFVRAKKHLQRTSASVRSRCRTTSVDIDNKALPDYKTSSSSGCNPAPLGSL